MTRPIVHHGDCREVMAQLIAEGRQFDSAVTDPPYHLASITKRLGKPGSAPIQHGTDGAYARATRGFMGKKWDGGNIAFDPDMWCLVFDLLKPGAHLLAFSGTRTYHRMAVAIEDAGFEIRDQIGWLYGCLDDQTEVVTIDGVKPFHKTIEGDLVLCYDAQLKTYSYQPIQERIEYEYDDTAYRLVGDHFEQVVSRNHRVIVERGGRETFVIAETLEQQAIVPVLENLPELLQALSDNQSDAGSSQSVMQQGVQGCTDLESKFRQTSASCKEGHLVEMSSVYSGIHAAECVDQEGKDTSMQRSLQWFPAGREVERLRPQGALNVEGVLGDSSCGEDDWRTKPCMEGRSDVPKPKGTICASADKVRAVSARNVEHGAERRIRDGASADCCAGYQEVTSSGRGSPSQEPSSDGQYPSQPDAIRDERRTQSVRAWRGHTTSMVRVVPFKYTGRVWCLRVPTGAFVAVRGGVAFPTGNSGFPKSHNVGRTLPEWEGWGTALKPAWEPICVARKPLIGTVAENVLAHGTGALNIDGCRIGKEAVGWSGSRGGSDDEGQSQGRNYRLAGGEPRPVEGRWPANVIHDGSDEVVASFPETRSGALTASQQVNGGFAGTVHCYGTAAGGGTGQYDSSQGSAARFFYSAKADSVDRLESKHPTVKPVDLMAYLCRLVTPPGGTVLDPFAGSGTTGMACMREGFGGTLIEREAEYVGDILRRIDHVSGANAPLFSGIAK